MPVSPTSSEHALAFARGDAGGPRVVTVVTRAAGLLAAVRRVRRRHGRRAAGPVARRAVRRARSRPTARACPSPTLLADRPVALLVGQP